MDDRDCTILAIVWNKKDVKKKTPAHQNCAVCSVFGDIILLYWHGLIVIAIFERMKEKHVKIIT